MPPPALPMKDPRPLRDRQYQLKMRQDIVAQLQDTGYDIHPSTLANITGKDFRSIFQHLVLLLDPCHPFNQSSRFEDEFVPAMRALRYPFVSQLDPKWLAAPASMHSWPTLLGVLHWLVNMVKVSGSITLFNGVCISESRSERVLIACLYGTSNDSITQIATTLPYNYLRQYPRSSTTRIITGLWRSSIVSVLTSGFSPTRTTTPRRNRSWNSDTVSEWTRSMHLAPTD